MQFEFYPSFICFSLNPLACNLDNDSLRRKISIQSRHYKFITLSTRLSILHLSRENIHNTQIKILIVNGSAMKFYRSNCAGRSIISRELSVLSHRIRHGAVPRRTAKRRDGSGVKEPSVAVCNTELNILSRVNTSN